MRPYPMGSHYDLPTPPRSAPAANSLICHIPSARCPASVQTLRVIRRKNIFGPLIPLHCLKVIRSEAPPLERVRTRALHAGWNRSMRGLRPQCTQPHCHGLGRRRTHRSRRAVGIRSESFCVGVLGIRGRIDQAGTALLSARRRSAAGTWGPSVCLDRYLF